MRHLGKSVVLVVSGAFLSGGTVSADPDRNHNLGRKYEQNDRDCGNSRKCRGPGNSAKRYDRHDVHRPHYVDNRRHHWERDRDYRRNTNIEVRISTYPIYINTDRSHRYQYRTPPRRVIAYDYRPYYREYGVASNPGHSVGYVADNTRGAWNDNRPTYDVAPQHIDNEYCREYYTEADVQGQTRQVYGTACMQPDGSWKIIN